jgi:hypothetical protein
MREINLTQGKVAIVDDADYEYLSRLKWHYHHNGYAVRKSPRNGGPQHVVQMHRIILDAPGGIECDHVNGNGLDNRRCNLRLATTAENQHNQGQRSDNTSGYKGVTWDATGRKWRAQIKVAGREIYLGLFTDKILAAQAYNTAATKYFGEYARMNFARGES